MRRFMVLCAALALLLCACGSPAPDSQDGTLITVGGTELERNEIEYLIINAMDQYAASQEINWEGRIEGLDSREYFRTKAQEIAVNAHITSIKAEELGFGLTDAEESEIDWEISQEIEYSGGREAFADILAQSSLTEAVYRFYSYTVPYLHEKLLNGLFGQKASTAEEEQALRDYFSKNYVTASYIFLSATDDYGEMLTGEDWETQKAIAEALRRQAVSGENFVELVNTHGQDYLMSLTPGGMPIQLGQYGTVFDAALTALGDNEISEVVATGEGFYIILRLADDWDWFEQNKDSVWYFYSSESLTNMIAQWSTETDIVIGGAFYAIDPKSLYYVG